MKLKHERPSSYILFCHRIPILNRIAAYSDIAEKIARLTNIGAKKARLCGYRTPYNGPTVDTADTALRPSQTAHCRSTADIQNLSKNRQLNRK